MIARFILSRFVIFLHIQSWSISDITSLSRRFSSDTCFLRKCRIWPSFSVASGWATRGNFILMAVLDQALIGLWTSRHLVGVSSRACRHLSTFLFKVIRVVFWCLRTLITTIQFFSKILFFLLCSINYMAGWNNILAKKWKCENQIGF